MQSRIPSSHGKGWDRQVSSSEISQSGSHGEERVDFTGMDLRLLAQLGLQVTMPLLPPHKRFSQCIKIVLKLEKCVSISGRAC